MHFIENKRRAHIQIHIFCGRKDSFLQIQIQVITFTARTYNVWLGLAMVWYEREKRNRENNIYIHSTHTHIYIFLIYFIITLRIKYGVGFYHSLCLVFLLSILRAFHTWSVYLYKLYALLETQIAHIALCLVHCT